MKSAKRLAAEICGNSNRGVRIPELLAQVRGGDNFQLRPVDVPREALENASATADHKMITHVTNGLLSESRNLKGSYYQFFFHENSVCMERE
jgi:hypothetical protein